MTPPHRLQLRFDDEEGGDSLLPDDSLQAITAADAILSFCLCLCLCKQMSQGTDSASMQK